jgi:transposase
VDLWDLFLKSIEQWAPQCKIIYDKFHVWQHVNGAVDEVRLPTAGWQLPANGRPGGSPRINRIKDLRVMA